MLGILILWLGSAALLYLTAILVPGFVITSFSRALIAALVVGLLNVFIRPFIWFLTLPINIITLGLFTLVINAIILRLAAGLLKGFDIKGWGSALLGALLLALLRIALHFGPFATVEMSV